MKRLLAASLFAFVISCGFSAPASAGLNGPEVDPTITDGTAARELGEARAIWKKAKVSGYRLKISRGCFCAPPRSVKVTVRKGTVVNVTNKGWYGPWTVGGLFRTVAESIEGEAAKLDVNYDQQLGYPRSISIDHIAMAVDDEIGYTASLTRLRPSR